MDWNTREKVLEYFIDFVIGEIDEIEDIISWADARHHPETAMNKIRQIVVARQSVAIYARDVLMEQCKLPDRWAVTAGHRPDLSTKNKGKLRGGALGPGESSRQVTPQQSSTSTGKSKRRGKAKSTTSSHADMTWPPLLSWFKGRIKGQGIIFKSST